MTRALLAVVVLLLAVIAYQPALEIWREATAPRIKTLAELCLPPKADAAEAPARPECIAYWRATGVIAPQ